MTNKCETIFDYIRWRGDLTFKKDPFNIFDNLVFCFLTYLDLSKVYKEKMSIKQAYEKISKKNCFAYKTVTFGKQEKEIFKTIALSKRFGDVSICHYVDICEKENTQFCAMQFVIDYKTIYVAYRGTDSSVIGWKENFMLTFTNNLAQEYARKYLEKYADFYHSYYVGGHSKGANLAMYAASYCKQSIQDKIIRVYDNDGPGFCREVFDQDKLAKIYPITSRIVPVFDVVGQIFYNDEIIDNYIVKSNEKYISQHSLISWQLDALKFASVEKIDDTALFIVNSLMDWLDKIPIENRKDFVDAIFEGIEANTANDVNDLFRKPTKLLEVYRYLIENDKNAKDYIDNLPKAVIDNFLKEINERFPSKQERKSYKIIDRKS